MVKKDATEEKRARLITLAQEAPDDVLCKELKKALASGSNIVAAQAAHIARAKGLTQMESELADAFTRFMEKPVQRDGGCIAKLAIVEALRALEVEADRVFLAGVRHVQMEPTWGMPEDTAGALRGACGQALAQTNYPDALFELAGLLMDPEPPARRAAIQAVAYVGGTEGELLLRMKALAGDPDPDIMGDCLAALMRLEPARSLEFVAARMDSEEPAIAEAAAIALGESHREDAFALLRARWESCVDAESRRMLLLPLALMRSEESIAFLLEIIREANKFIAAGAISVLGACYLDELKKDILDAIRERSEREVKDAFEAAFND